MMTCAHGAVSNVRMQRFTASPLEAMAELEDIKCSWLPPTVEIAHFIDLNLGGCVETSHLPRNLRYLCFYSCFNGGSMNFRRLPSRMREIHLLGSIFEGNLDLIDLPPKMEYISCIRSSIPEVMIRNDHLPDSLKRLLIGRSRKIRITSHANEKLDSRIQLVRGSCRIESEFYDSCQRSIREIQSSISDRGLYLAY